MDTLSLYVVAPHRLTKLNVLNYNAKLKTLIPKYFFNNVKMYVVEQRHTLLKNMVPKNKTFILKVIL